MLTVVAEFWRFAWGFFVWNIVQENDTNLMHELHELRIEFYQLAIVVTISKADLLSNNSCNSIEISVIT